MKKRIRLGEGLREQIEKWNQERKEKRRRERMERRTRLARRSKPINEVDYFVCIVALLCLKRQTKLRVVFYDRISSDSQLSEESYIARRRYFINKYRGILQFVRFFTEVCSGRSDRLDDRTVLGEAIAYAKKHGLFLFIPCVNRLVRPEGYSIYEKYEPLREDDIERLLPLLRDVRIAFEIPPGTPECEVTRILTQWGQWGKDSYGGRPKTKKPGWMKRRREWLIEEAIAIYRHVKSYRKTSMLIEDEFGERVSKSVIWEWFHSQNLDGIFCG